MNGRLFNPAQGAARRPVPQPRRAARGFSLIELMVALLIGMLVIGALMAGYYAIAVSNRNGQARAQVTEDASLALNMLRANVREAGYSRPTGVAGTKYVQAYAGRALAGCDNSFVDLNQDIGALTCTAGAGHASIAVAYEADSTANGNSLLSGGVPLDCLGNALPLTGAGATSYYLNYSRFYLAASQVSPTHTALYCRGPGNAAGQALVENIEDMQIQYGVSNNLAASPVQVAYYAKASALANLDNVVTVRICVLAVSTDEVMDAVTPYTDCNGTVGVVPADRRMRRAFTTTIVLHNRLG